LTDRRRHPETVTADELADYGLTVDDLRRWPVTEYGPPGNPYWLLRDLVAAGLVPDTTEE
jgi:hypothetical protein